jgi:hypothetical protein
LASGLSELEVQAARRGLVADEAEGLEVPGALRVGEPDGANVVAGHGDEEGIGEIEVGVAELPREVVTEAESEVDPVEALGDEHREVVPPERPVVPPALVLDVADEQPHDAADPAGRSLDDRRRRAQRRERLRGAIDPVHQISEGVDEPEGIRRARQQQRAFSQPHGCDGEGFGGVGDARSGLPQELPCQGGAAAGRQDAQLTGACVLDPPAGPGGEAARSARLQEELGGPLRRTGRGDRVARIEDERHPGRTRRSAGRRARAAPFERPGRRGPRQRAHPPQELSSIDAPRA